MVSRKGGGRVMKYKERLGGKKREVRNGKVGGEIDGDGGVGLGLVGFVWNILAPYDPSIHGGVVDY